MFHFSNAPFAFVTNAIYCLQLTVVKQHAENDERMNESINKNK